MLAVSALYRAPFAMHYPEQYFPQGATGLMQLADNRVGCRGDSIANIVHL